MKEIIIKIGEIKFIERKILISKRFRNNEIEKFRIYYYRLNVNDNFFIK